MSYDKVKQASALRVGAKQAAKAVEAGIAREVFVANDADPRVTHKVINLCKKMNVPVIYVDSMKQLGQTCGIDVSTSIVAVVGE